jgi:DNA-binding NarL/FixJ family response regulator
MINVLLVDNYPVVLKGMQEVLEGLSGIRVVDSAASGRIALQIIAEIDASEQSFLNIIVLDIGMPEMSGIEVAKVIRERYPYIKILIYSMHNEIEYVRQLKRIGINGYIVKEDLLQELEKAIRAIANGSDYYSEAIRSAVMAGLSESPTEAIDALSEKEIAVLKLVVKGHLNPEIAEILNLAPKTIESHKTNLLKKLGLRNALELVRFGMQNGLE